MNNSLKNIISVVLSLAFIFGFIYIVFSVIMFFITPLQPVQSIQSVVEVCQYPGRVYADGSCNNSDPCDPTTLKDPVLKGDCPKGVIAEEPDSVDTSVPETQGK